MTEYPFARRTAAALGALLLLATAADSQPLDCNGSPFGNRLLLAGEREIVLGVANTSASRAGAQPIYITAPTTSDRKDSINDLTGIGSVALDLNGDGIDETVIGGIDSDSGDIKLSVLDATGSQINRFTLAAPAGLAEFKEFDVVAADLDGSLDGHVELVFSALATNGELQVFGIFGAANGGLIDTNVSQVLGSISISLFLSRQRGADTLQLAAGDFLLEGNDQIAVVTGDSSDGNITTEIVRYGSGTNNGQSAYTFSFPAYPSDVASSIGAMNAAAGFFEPGDGAQLIIASQEERSANTRLSYRGFSLEVSANGTITHSSLFDLENVDILDAPQAFELKAGDLSRNGFDELVVAYADSRNGNAVVQILRPRNASFPGEPVIIGETAFPIDASSGLALAVGDVDRDGFADIFLATAGTSAVDLRQLVVDRGLANEMGTGCSSAGTIGDSLGNCPRKLYRPVPDPTGDVLGGNGFGFNQYTGQPVEGIWTLCMADVGSDGFGPSEFHSWTLTVNGRDFTSSASVVPIQDNFRELRACQEIEVTPDVLDERVGEVSAAISVDHGGVGDLIIELRSPRGSPLTLLNRSRVAGPNLRRGFPVEFTDGAQISLSSTDFTPSTLDPGPYDSLSLALPDLDGDSVAAAVSDVRCRQVTEDTATTVVFMPPFFPVQVPDVTNMAAFIGQSSTDGRTEGVAVEQSRGNDVSGFVGLKVGIESGDPFSVFTAGVEASARATAGRNYERLTGMSDSTSSSQTLSVSNSATGVVVGALTRERSDAFCYSYDVIIDSEIDETSFVRFCEAGPARTSSPSVQEWNLDPNPPAEWTMIVRDWENLALDATATSNELDRGLQQPDPANPERAIDGRYFDKEEAVDDVDIVKQVGAYLLIDLGEVQDIYGIRIHQALAEAPRLAQAQLYIYEDERPIGIFGAEFPVGDDVTMFDPTSATNGQALEIVNVPTVRLEGDEIVPTRGRFIRLSGPAQDSEIEIFIVELQVFGSGINTPDRNPVAVCDPIRGDGEFEVKRFNQAFNNGSGGFQWIDMAGNVDWMPDGPNNGCDFPLSNSPFVQRLGVLANRSLQGSSTTDWDLTNEFTRSLESTSGNSFSSRRGAEFDVEVTGGIGPITVAAQVGGGYEFSSGVTSVNSTEVFWTRSLNVGGVIPGIPLQVNNQHEICDHMPRPFAYRAPYFSNTGFQHVVLAVDYLVERLGTWEYGNVPEVCNPPPPPPPTAPVVFDVSFSIFDTALDGSVVGQLEFGDVNDNIPATGAFAITAGNDDGVFGVNDLGQIVIADSTSLAVGQVMLTITATDTTDLVGTGTATINVARSSASPEIDVTRGTGRLITGSTEMIVSETGPVQLTYTIANQGRLDLAITAATATSGTNVSGLTVSTQPDASVPPGATTEMVVEFNVDTAGPYGFELLISNNDPNEGSYAITVEGATTTAVLEAELIKDRILVDNDGDEKPNPSDTLRFQVLIRNRGDTLNFPTVFTLEAPPNTSFFNVFRDNSLGETTLLADQRTIRAEIADPNLAMNAQIQDALSFDLLIGNDALPGATLEFQGTFSYQEVSTRTDDPTIAGLQDATQIELGNTARLLAPQDAGGFGQATAFGPGLAIVGSPRDNGGDGSVFVYRVNEDGSRTQAARIQPPAGFASGSFGAAVAVNGSTLLVGAPGVDRVAVFSIATPESPSLDAEIASPLGAMAQFGASLAFDGSTIAVGAPAADTGAGAVGQAFVFQLGDVLGAKGVPANVALAPTAPAAGGRFGASLAIASGRVVVGMPGPIGGSVAGSAEMFSTVGDNLATLNASPGLTEFGASLVLRGDTLVVGAPTQGGTGAALTFDVSSVETSGALTGMTLSIPSSTGFDLGRAVAIADGEIYVGAPKATATALIGSTQAGTVYRFGPSGALVETIGAFADAPGDPAIEQQSGFGASLAVGPNGILIGAPESEGARGSAAIRIMAVGELAETVFRNGFETP